MKKILFIYNPFAGKGKIRSNLSDIVEVLSSADFEITVYPTQHEKDAFNLAAEKAKDYDVIVCSGGDGTLDEVVGGVLRCGKKIPIGYLPCGSTNDFASSLDLPRNLIDAAKVITDGELFSCDVGRFSENTFVYIAAFGMFTEVSYETPQPIKNAIGHAAYLLEGIKSIPELRAYHISMDCNEDHVEGDFVFGMITNTTSVGGIKNITGKYVELNDGLFEVTLIRMPKNPMELNGIVSDFLNGNRNADCVYYAKTDHVRIHSDEVIAWTLDGEYGGAHVDVDIGCLPNAIDIFVPQGTQYLTDAGRIKIEYE